MSRMIKILFFFVLCSSPLFAQSLYGVWVEADLDGLTFPKVKYAFTNDLLKLRDMKAREQTVYPYVYKDGYLYLSEPTQVTRTNLRLNSKRFKCKVTEKTSIKYITLTTETDEYILLSEESVKNGWNTVGDIFEFVGIFLIGKGSGDLIDLKSTDYRKTKFQKKTVYQNDKLFDPYQKDARGRTNIERMKKGLAPIGKDGKSINLHHADQTENGPLYEVSDSMHKKHYNDLHTNTGQEPSDIDRPEFDSFRADYWKNRAKEFTK